MIKVFLVEDEVIIRNGIRNTIHWEAEGMQFVGEAGDGEIAYPLILKTKPDILITDIRMPFMDGLELSRIIKRELPATKIIILSGYGEFEYAKQAISLGVTDYLLKPVRSSRLLEALHQVCKMIISEQQHQDLLRQYAHDQQMQRQLATERLYWDFITGRLTVSEVLDQGQALAISFSSSYYQIIIVKLLSDTGGEKISESEWQAWARWEELLSSETGIKTVQGGAEGTICMLAAEDELTLEQLQVQAEGVLETILTQFKGLHYFGGVGSVVVRLGDISRSYAEASKAVANRFFLEWNQFLSLGQIAKIHGQDNGQIDLAGIRSVKKGRTQVTSFLKSAAADEVPGFVDGYLRSMGEKNYQSLMFRQYLVMNVFVECVSFLEELEQDAQSLSKESQEINQVMGQTRAADPLKRYLKTVLSDTIQIRDQLAGRKYGLLMASARQYIEENFSNKEISLGLTADYVNMSVSYFSSLFSQQTGQTFVEYLTQIRLKKAKELLLCTNLRTSEIGYQIGYRDPHYFSYLFKKNVSCSPKEYRARGGGTSPEIIYET